MLYAKIQPQSLLGSEEGFEVFLPYMGMAAILFNIAKPFEQIVSTTLTGVPCEIRRKMAQFKKRRHLNIYTILYMYKAQEQGQISPGG